MVSAGKFNLQSKTVKYLFLILIGLFAFLEKVFCQDSMSLNRPSVEYQINSCIYSNTIQSGYIEMEKEICNVGLVEGKNTRDTVKLHFLKMANGQLSFWFQLGKHEMINFDNELMKIDRRSKNVFIEKGNSDIPAYRLGIIKTLVNNVPCNFPSWVGVKGNFIDFGVAEFVLKKDTLNTNIPTNDFEIVLRYKDSVLIYYETRFKSAGVSTINIERILKIQLNIYDSISFGKKVQDIVRDSLSDYCFEKIVRKSGTIQWLDTAIFKKKWDFYELSGDKYINPNKLTILTFSYIGCAPCQIFKIDLKEIDSIFKARNLEIITVNPIDSVDRIKTHNDKTNYHLKTLVADKNYCQTNFAYQGYPRIYVIDANGNLLATYKGYSLENVKNLKKLLAEHL